MFDVSAIEDLNNVQNRKKVYINITSCFQKIHESAVDLGLVANASIPGQET